jgi:hypothetical protein
MESPESMKSGNAVQSVADKHRDEILKRMANGEAVSSIARSLGYATHAGIGNRLRDDPDYQAALKHGVVGRLEKREQELEAAQDNVSVTRADRLLNHARWWAERIDRNTFAQKPDIAININNISGLDGAMGLQASDLLAQVRGVVIEHDAEQQTADIAQEIGKDDVSR